MANQNVTRSRVDFAAVVDALIAAIADAETILQLLAHDAL
jgi:hypothetical protein